MRFALIVGHHERFSRVRGEALRDVGKTHENDAREALSWDAHRPPGPHVRAQYGRLTRDHHERGRASRTIHIRHLRFG